MKKLRSPTRSHRRAGLAPLELTLSLPIMLFVMGLMIIAGTSAAWKARTVAAARHGVWRTLHPRTGHDDPNPLGWPQEASMSAGEANRFALDADPYLLHEVVRGQPLGSPTGESIEVFPEALDMQLDLMLGTAGIQRQLPVMANMRSEGIQMYREHLVLDGDWRFPTMRRQDGQRGLPANRYRRIQHIYPADLERRLNQYADEYQRTALVVLQDPDRPLLETLDNDFDLQQRRPAGLDYTPPYGIGYAPDYYLPENRDLRRRLTNPERECTYNASVLMTNLGGDLSRAIENVPRRLARDHIRMYQSHVAHIDRLLELLDNPGQTPPRVLAALQGKRGQMERDKQELEGKVDQLRSYLGSL